MTPSSQIPLRLFSLLSLAPHRVPFSLTLPLGATVFFLFPRLRVP